MHITHGVEIDRTYWVNGNRIALLFSLELKNKLKPGLYLPNPDFVVGMRLAERLAVADFYKELVFDQEVIDAFEDKIRRDLKSKILPPFLKKEFKDYIIDDDCCVELFQLDNPTLIGIYKKIQSRKTFEVVDTIIQSENDKDFFKGRLFLKPTEKLDEIAGPKKYEPSQERVLASQLISILNADERELIELYFANGLNYQEISRRKCIPTSTVGSRVRSALEKMRAYSS